MAPDPGGSPSYPWDAYGNGPWPGTAPNYDSHWDPDKLRSLVTALDSKHRDLKAHRKILQDANRVSEKDFGTWDSAIKMHSTANAGNVILLDSYDYFMKALEDLISRLEHIQKLNRGIEDDNKTEIHGIDTTTFVTGQSVDPSDPSNKLTNTPPYNPKQPDPGSDK